MNFTPLVTKFPASAEKETRVVTVLSEDEVVPVGKYAFIENYCDDSSCDCRKVMINIVDAHNPSHILATIGFGWESVSWYTEWMGGDANIGQMLAGSYLDPGGVQSEGAHAFLELWKTIVVRDANYTTRIKTNYRIFKGKDDAVS